MAGRVIPEPYVYPDTPHVRRHGPRGFNDYKRYRPRLRDEFSFRCVYCLEREVWRDMRDRMHIDHFVPQAIRKDLKCDYSNLLYACPGCNKLKGTKLLPDPCQLAFGKHLRINEDGSIESITDDIHGEILIEVLALNDPLTVSSRRRLIGTLRSLAATDWSLFVEWMRYPQNLPDLEDKDNRPPDNDKPEGIAQSHFKRDKRGELPEVY